MEKGLNAKNVTMKEKNVLDKLREVSLIFFGIYLPKLFEINFINFRLETIFEFFFPLLFLSIGLGLVDLIYHKFIYLFIRDKLLRGKIAIPFSMEIDFKKNSSWIEIPIEKIFSIFQKHFKISIKYNSKKFFYPVIINPYGGLYIEDNLLNLTTLDNIKEYVSKGGIYVNIADIPFWYSYSYNSVGKIETAPFTNNSLSKSHIDSVLYKIFGILTLSTNNIEKHGFNSDVERVFYMQNSNFTNLHELNIKSDNPNNIHNHNLSPFVRIKYGKGFFVFSTLRIRNVEDLEKIAEAIKDVLNLKELK